MFGATPAYGFYVRHIDGIEFNNVQVSYDGVEARPAFSLNDVKNADFMHVKAQRAEGVPAFSLQNTFNFPNS